MELWHFWSALTNVRLAYPITLVTPFWIWYREHPHLLLDASTCTKNGSSKSENAKIGGSVIAATSVSNVIWWITSQVNAVDDGVTWLGSWEDHLMVLQFYQNSPRIAWNFLPDPITIEFHQYSWLVLLITSSLATHYLDLTNIFILKQYDIKMHPISDIEYRLMPSFSNAFHVVFPQLALYVSDDLQTSLNKLGYLLGIEQ